jgi:hypothetical protein
MHMPGFVIKDKAVREDQRLNEEMRCIRLMTNLSADQAIITQNGNVYEQGLGPFWAPLRRSRSEVWVIQGIAPVVQGVVAKTTVRYRRL